MLDSNFTLKLADFGLARSIEAPLFDQVQERRASLMSGPELTNKVITLWYRPPEILLGAVQYGTAVDVWSAGCVLAELILGKPLFTAKTELDQLTMILEMLGPPPSPDTYDYFESGMKKDTAKVPLSLSRSQRPPGKLRAKYAEKMPQAALALIEKMLAWDPRQRVTAANALSHRYFWTEPVAPANPAELGETLNIGGPNGHFHEFQTKKKRKQAKAFAEEAKEKARLKGATEEEAQAVQEKVYRKLIKKVYEEGLGANEGNASGSTQPTPSERPPTIEDPDDRRGKDRHRRSADRSSSRGRYDDDETRRRDRGSRDRYEDESRRSRGRESRRSRDPETGRKRRRDDMDDSRRSRRSRERRSRDDEDGKERRRDEPRDLDMPDVPSRNGGVEPPSRDQDVVPDERPPDGIRPFDEANRPIRADRDALRDKDLIDRSRDRAPGDRPPHPDFDRPREVFGDPDRPRDRPPYDGPPDGIDRLRRDERERYREPDDRWREGPLFDRRGPPDGRGRDRPPDGPPFDGRGPPDGRMRGRPPERPYMDDRRPPFDERGPPDGRARDRHPDRPPFDDRGPPDGRARDRPPFDDRGHPDRRGRDRRPPFDDRGAPDGRGRPMDRPPFDDRGPPGRARERPMERPPFDEHGASRDGPMFDERDRFRGRPPFDNHERPRDGPPFDGEGARDRPPIEDRRRMRERLPGDRDGPGVDVNPDDRGRRRMGPPVDEYDRYRDQGAPDNRERPGGGPSMVDGRNIPRDRPPPQSDEFDRPRRPHPRDDGRRYGPGGLDEDERYRRDFERGHDRPPFHDGPDDPERRPDRGDRRDKSDRRSGDSHRRRKKDKKRRERSRSRGRNDESRRSRHRDDRRLNDENPDYYGPPHGQEGERERDDRERHDDRRDRHRDRRDRDRGRH